MVAWALAGTAVLAQEEFELKQTDHPWLEQTADELSLAKTQELGVARVRARADEAIAKSHTVAYAEYSVALPKAEPPPAHGDDWPYWTDLCAELGSDMQTCAFAYVLTGERTYLNWCRELMIALTQWPQWTDPDYGNGQPGLDTQSLVRGMCVAYDYLYEALPERDRQQIAGAIADRGAAFIYEYGNREGSYLQQPGLWPNGYAMINAELGVAALMLMGEDERANGWLSQSLDKARLFFAEQGGVDGGLVEGFSHGGAAVDALSYLLTATERGVGVSLFDEPYLSQAISFPIYFQAPGGGSLVNFGDSGGPRGCPPTLLETARSIMEVDRSTEAAWYLKQVGHSHETIEKLAAPPTHLPLARHFRSIDWVAMRSGWGVQDTLLAFRSGATDHHNHRDQNSLMVAWGSEWLLNDPGYQIYDRPYPPERNMSETVIKNRHAYTAGTVGHNAILIDGQGQIARAGEVTQFARTVAMDCTTGDASAAYGSTAQTVVRHVVSVPPDYYAVFDRVVTDGAERTVDVLLHTPSEGRFTVEGRSLNTDQQRAGREARIKTRTGEAVVRFTHPEEPTFTHRRWPDCDEYGHFLKVTSPAAVEHTICWAVAAGAAGEVDLETRAAQADEGVTSVQTRVGTGLDTLALNTTGGEAAVGEMRLSGLYGLVRTQGGELRRYALVHGTLLAHGSRDLVSSDEPVTVGMATDAGVIRISVSCEATATVKVHCPVGTGLVQFEGLDQPVEVTVDGPAQTLTLTAPAGRYELTVRPM